MQPYAQFRVGNPRILPNPDNIGWSTLGQTALGRDKTLLIPPTGERPSNSQKCRCNRESDFALDMAATPAVPEWSFMISGNPHKESLETGREVPK
jgi:hypothetical protein